MREGLGDGVSELGCGRRATVVEEVLEQVVQRVRQGEMDVRGA